MSDNTNVQDQEDEICVLNAIYDKEEFDANDDFKGGQFYAFVNLPSDFIIRYKNYGQGAESIKIPISHLPPITLTFKFPATYPSLEKPEYEISCLWLSITKLNKICDKLDKLWEENKGTVILYTWTQFLKEELLTFLGMKNSLDLCRQYLSEIKKKDTLNTQKFETPLDLIQTTSKIPTQNPEQLKKRYTVIKDPRIIIAPLVRTHLHEYLISFNTDKCKMKFMKTLYTCDICFEDLLGVKCVQLKPCDHVYCKECLKTYFEVRINDGQVHSMPCPHDKCKSEAQQHQIKDAVGLMLYLKYDNLLLNSTLDTMSDITYCPRTFCSCPVVRDCNEKMATCPKCEYVFCAHCKMTYHGVDKCKLKAERIIAIMDEYQNGNAETKAKLEKIYGKKEIVSYIDVAKSEKWIESNSKSCPKCQSAIEKSDGCNKMECSKCHAYFCWICLTILDPTKPYKHFDDSTSKCYNKLFLGVEIRDDIDDDFVFDEDFGEDFEEVEEFEFNNLADYFYPAEPFQDRIDFVGGQNIIINYNPDFL